VKTACPSCGADVEFRYDDSFVRVCSYCHAAVQRTDRGVESLGKFADVVPLDSPLRLFAEGRLGSQSFMLVGMAQLRHEAGGLTQEWYARFSDSWGWLAEAQGRYYMTFEVEGAALPALGSLAPGDKVELPTMLGATRTFTVGEVGSSTYIAANGELPFRLAPQSSYQFVDLADGDGNFATIDYGEDGDEPALYVGKQCALSDLDIRGGEDGPPRDAKISSSRLACPNCNAPVELRAGDQTLRVACSHCGQLLDFTAGALAIVGTKQKLGTRPRIALGTTGTFADGELTVIGFVQRSAIIDGEWYPFEEYLLYAPEVGFRWLVSSDGHWSYVQPIETGAVEYRGTDVVYDGVTMKLFQTATLRVDLVLGELYWKVEIGEQVEGLDFIAPPAMISKESTESEENWSLSTYMTLDAVDAAFGGKYPSITSPIGVAPNQPDPLRGSATPLTLAFVALLLIGILFAATSNPRIAYDAVATVPGGTPVAIEPTATNPDPVPSNVFFSEPFELVGGKNVELGFRASGLANNWVYVVASLVNTATGDVYTVDANMDYYSGVDDGEAWNEGNPGSRSVIGPVAAGAYVVRLEMQQGGATEIPMTVRVRQGVFRGKWLGWAAFVLGIPFLIAGTKTYTFERKRWSNSSQGTSGAPKSGLTMMVGGIVVVLGGLIALIRAFAEASGDD
jgi:hypothetical protein